MRTYVLVSDTNVNYLAHARFDVLAFVHSCVRSGPESSGPGYVITISRNGHLSLKATSFRPRPPLQPQFPWYAHTGQVFYIKSPVGNKMNVQEHHPLC